MRSGLIDTLSIAKRLQSAGYTQMQAEAQASIWAEVIDEKLVTKAELRDWMQELEYRLMLRLGSVMVVGISITATLARVL